MKDWQDDRVDHSDDDASVSSTVWWETRRLRYNLGLVASGILAFFSYCTVQSIFHDALADVEITVFTVAFQGAAYLFCIGIANVCYFTGFAF